MLFTANHFSFYFQSRRGFVSGILKFTIGLPRFSSHSLLIPFRTFLAQFGDRSHTLFFVSFCYSFTINNITNRSQNLYFKTF